MILGLIDGYLENKYQPVERVVLPPRETICLDEYLKVCRVCTVPIPEVKTFWQRAWEFLNKSTPEYDL